MSTHNIYNLYVGDKHPGATFAVQQIGPFNIRLVDDYETSVHQLYRPERKVVSYGLKGGGTKDRSISFGPASPGEWVVTAVAEQTGSGESLLYPDAADNGLTDLCGLLTFCTGRRVTTEEHLTRYSFRTIGTPACVPIETLRAASVAWTRRQRLHKLKIIYALLLYNEGLTQNLLGAASLFNTALNILIHKTPHGEPQLDNTTKKTLKETVQQAVNGVAGLTEEQKNGFRAVLGARVDQGLGGALEKFRALLSTLCIVDNPPSECQKRRLQYVNRVRNRLVHAGHLPTLDGLDQKQSQRSAVAIVIGIVPEIVQKVLGEELGFRLHGVGSLSQYTDDLRIYFASGIWHNWPVEEVSFDEWFFDDEA